MALIIVVNPYPPRRRYCGVGSFATLYGPDQVN